MSNEKVSKYEIEIEKYIDEHHENEMTTANRNSQLEEETSQLNWEYDIYLSNNQYVLRRIREEKYDDPNSSDTLGSIINNKWEAIEHVIQSNYKLNSEYVKLFRSIIENSIEMREKIEELEEIIEDLTTDGGTRKSNGGTRKSYRKLKIIKVKSKKMKE